MTPHGLPDPTTCPDCGEVRTWQSAGDYEKQRKLIEAAVTGNFDQFDIPNTTLPHGEESFPFGISPVIGDKFGTPFVECCWPCVTKSIEESQRNSSNPHTH